MKLNEHLEQVIRRSRNFHRAKEPGHILINAIVPAPTPAIPPLHSFDLAQQLDRWLDYQLEAARPFWQIKEGLDDDALPAICPYFGIAEHSAWLGTDVQFQETTSLPIPMLHSVDALSDLKLSTSTPWFHFMREGYKHLRNRKDGTFFLSVRGTMMPMDIANAIRGDEIFLDFLLNPDFAHRLMQFLVDAIYWYYRHLISWADNIQGGYVYKFGSGWIEGNCLGHTSNDLAMLCSSEIYDEFGFPYERVLTEKFQSVLYHVHNEKVHYVPHLVNLPNLSLLEVSHDPKTPEPIEELSRIFHLTGSVNLMLYATSDQVRRHIEELQERNVFLNVQCQDRADADDIVAFVRAHSRSL